MTPNLHAVLSAHTTLRRHSSGDWIGVCPFCHKPGVLVVRNSPEQYHCFACQQSGDASTVQDDLASIAVPRSLMRKIAHEIDKQNRLARGE